MDSELICSNNNLYDLINWSKNGYIIILNRKSQCKLYSRPEYKLSNKVVQINLSHRWESLMDDGEWPWYLIESGCVQINKYDFLNIDLSDVTKFFL
jgi:hypothetical protein